MYSFYWYLQIDITIQEIYQNSLNQQLTANYPVERSV